MPFLWVEISGFNGYTLERWKVPVKKTMNIPDEAIFPVESRKGQIRFIKVGKGVEPEKVEKYFVEYLRQKGLWDKVIRLQLRIS
jgi:hypothetical protein